MTGTEIIRAVPLFADLSREAVEDLASVAVRRSLPGGAILFSEGEAADALFLLADGAIDLVKASPDGKVQHVRSVRRGEMFAEAAMFSGETYPATAVARKPSRLLAIRKERFVAFVRRHPDVSLTIMGAMARLLRHLNALLADLSLGQVSNRLAAFLIARSRERRKIEFSLGIQKQELALRLGTIPATLSRNLRKLKDSGIIDVRGDFVTIKKMKALDELAGRP